MRHLHIKKLLPILTLSLAAAGCAEDSSDSDGTPGSVGLTPGGSQDFGLFRQILEDGGIPGPETIDDVGFFAEHKLDYPAPSCGEDLCLAAMLGAGRNLADGTGSTVVQIGLTSPIDPASLERPPMHLVVAVDVSGSMQGEPINYLRAGLHEMLPELQSGDQLSLVKYSGEASVVLEAVPVESLATITGAIDNLSAGGSTNLYAGLFRAFAVADAHLDGERQNRVIFMSDGVATTGLQNPVKLRSLAEAYARRGIALTTIGVGKDFDVEVMRNLGEIGAGNFYFLEDPFAVREVFSEEVRTFLVPAALDVRIDLSLADAYRIRGAFGTSRFVSAGSGGSISLPSLFLAGRTSSADPIDSGRRGGGGTILVELGQGADLTGSEPPDVGEVTISWVHPGSGDEKTQQISVVPPYSPADLPLDGYFSGATVEKGFMMLNLYWAFERAAALTADSDPRTAQLLLSTVGSGVASWLESYDDADIEDDLRYVDMFVHNLDSVIELTTPYEPAAPDWMY